MYTNKHLNNLNLAKSSREDTDVLQTSCNVLFGYFGYCGYFGFSYFKIYIHSNMILAIVCFIFFNECSKWRIYYRSGIFQN